MFGRPLTLLGLVACLAACPACSDATNAGTSQAAASTVVRSQDPRLLEARAALESGRPSAARTLLENLGAQAGVEGPLCLARAHLAVGAVVEALAQVERARELDPADPRVFATSAEILALAGKGADARDELERGLDRAPTSPDLMRAQAFLNLTRPGEAPQALARLQAALKADPKTPYVNWPLAQAYLLTGGQALGAGDLPGAIVAARAALELEPKLGEAEELLGAAQASANDFDNAIAAFGRAEALGQDVRDQLREVHRRAGMIARLASDHNAAEEHYLAVRELADVDSDMGASGKDYLEDRARVAFEAGMAAKLGGDHVAAAAAFAASVRLAPRGPLALDALDGQAGARFRQADYSGANLLWMEVQERELAGAEPEESRTHLNIARARVLGGDLEGARAILEANLARFPNGPAAAETRDLHAAVPEK